MITEYNADMINAAIAAKQGIAKRCKQCASHFAKDAFKYCADKISTPAKLADFLYWQFSLQGIDKSMVRASFRQYDIKFKRKYEEN